MYIAKNNNLIILAKDTKEELEQCLQFLVYTSIEETDIDYTLVNGIYMKPEEVKEQEKQARNAEIDTKIKELQAMALPEILQGNTENVKLYNNVIEGLNNAKL